MIEGYELKKKLSNDDRFDVYRAIHLQSQKQVIIKLPRDDRPSAEDIAILQHEFKILKQLQISGVIQAIKLVESHQTIALVCENINGISLATYIEKRAINLNVFFDFAIQLIDIICKLHEQKIIYKSLNSSSIYINDHVLKLTDFSHSTQLPEETLGFENRGYYSAITAYSAPEQTGRINRLIDYRTDFYSIGVIFFEMLTGTLPFQAEDRLELIHFIIAKSPPLVTEYNPTVPEVVTSIIAKLLSKMAEERYASLTGLKHDMIECWSQWKQNEKIKRFPIGVQDVYDHLNISHKLYGRKKQVEQLLTSFTRVSEGGCELILISGYSGVGKTSLVKEVHKPIVQQKGFFIQGKYDQLQSYIPFSALVTAFKGLVKQVLAESETKLLKIKKDLLNKLDKMGQVVIEVIPDVELIIGKQPPVPKLTSAETQNRFNFVFEKFVQVFAQEEHPIVIFLDDLQWADSASLKFLENILVNHETKFLLILGAYRSNEVDNTHPLRSTLRNLKKAQVIYHDIILQPLLFKSIRRLLVDTLNRDDQDIEALATLLHQKTHGNPFFINIFLKALYQEDILYFSYDKGQWHWDLHKIQQQTVTDNVIDLLTTRISKLSPATQKILKLAACFGHQFKIHELTIASEQTPSETAQQLWEAIQANLIINMDEIYKTTALLEASNEKHTENKVLSSLVYRFAHDRIQQAAFELIPIKRRAPLQLKIGRLLLKEKTLTENDERLFEIMEHFNQGLTLITDESEKHELAQYNLWAGIKAKTSTAYQAAKEYLQAGVTLLNPFDWEKNYKLLFALCKELAVCKYLTGEFQQAIDYFKLLIDNAKNKLDKIETYRLNCEMLSTLNKHEDAIELGLRALALLNIKLPHHPTPYHILKIVLLIKWKIGKQQIKDITLMPIQNNEKRAAIDLITQLLNNAFIVNQRLFVLLSCTNIYLSLTYGYTESNAMSLPVYAFVVIHSLHMYQEGMDFVELDKKLKHQYGTNSFQGKNEFILGAFIEPWRTEIHKCFNNLSNAFQLSCNTGDLVYAHYCNLLLVNTSSLWGKSLAEIKRYIQDTLSFTLKAKISDFYNVVSFWHYMSQCLEQTAEYNVNEIYNYEQKILAGKSKTELCFFYSYCAKLSYLLGDHRDSLKFGEKYFALSEYGLGMVNNVEFLFYYALSITSLFFQVPFKQRLSFYFKLNEIRKQMKRWAKWCPINFNHYLLLLDAEMASIKNKSEIATNLYDQAIKSASSQNSEFFAAVANECAARTYLNKNMPKLAKFYLSEAYSLFREFGATAKCRQLEKLFEQYFAETELSAPEKDVFTKSPKSIDMLAILKSTEIISSEIHLDRLRKKLLLIVLELAGAERGVILFKKSGHWLVEADGNLEQQKIYLNHEEQVNAKHLPVSLLNYVQRTTQPYIVQEATHSDITVFDPYVQEAKPRSLLMFPVLYQGQLSRIFYLENKSSTHVFTSENLQSLQLIASSAMISLENARLYHQASHDPLTGLANRNLLDQIFKVSASQTLRTHEELVFFFIDLDNFKTINDTLGHEVGDKLLVYAANQINKCLREGDLAARLGGDEFAILLAGIEDINQITAIADRLFTSIREPVSILGHQVQITCSMGICLYPKDAHDIQTLLKLADIALYQAKEYGKNQYYFYSESLQEQYRQIHRLEAELQQAIENQEFKIYYQPIIDIAKNKIVSLEALIRWQHPYRGLLDAKEFISVLEKKSLIIPVSEWLIRKVCQQVREWRVNGLLTVPIAINTSAVQFSNSQSVSKLIESVLNENNLDPSAIELELTESAFIETNNKVSDEIDAFLKMGIKLVIDDFGTGYSSLAYLKRLPVSKIKIDKSFFRKNKDNDFDLVIIGAITTLAHQLHLDVIAEGIEDEAQLAVARRLEIDAIQGYYYSYPLSTQECEGFLESIMKKAA